MGLKCTFEILEGDGKAGISTLEKTAVSGLCEEFF